jgi:formylglycine-generating enzyme required for sulfatase activity
VRRGKSHGDLVVVGLAAALALGAAVFFAVRSGEPAARCGPGFTAQGARCLAQNGCPPPLAAGPLGCDAPDVRVSVPESTFVIGPSDWEAEGRVAPRTVHVAAFAIDAFEATVAKVEGHASADGARAASGLSRAEAAAYCAARGGRLPTDDEWLAAAAGERGRRYPWGDTGAVCRRAAWGLAEGPCARGAVGPDTVGAHPDGDSPSGLHDLAGNVAEWVEGDHGAAGIARGGSFRTALATELRTWNRFEIAPGSHDPQVGVRCAYASP